MKNQPKYLSDPDRLYAALRSQLLEMIPHPHEGSYWSYAKAIGLLTLLATSLLMSYSSHSTPWILIWMAFAGLTTLPLVLNIGHEAVHRNLSPHPWVNQLGKRVFLLLGTSSYLWQLRHISAHHALPNVTAWDLDIEQSSLIRLADHQEHAAHHRHQHLYMPVAFCCYTLIWFFVRDFKDLQRHRFGLKKVSHHPAKEVGLLVFAKAFHLSLVLLLPWWIHGNLALAIAGFLVFHLCASVATTFVLVSTHVGEPQTIIDGHCRQLPYTFLEHQLQTTADFATQSWWITELLGGFNHHVAHHLFPWLPHRHSYQATRIIREFAKQHHLPYYCFDSLTDTLWSHHKRLRSLAVEL